MEPDTYARVVRSSGQGMGWMRVAASIADAVPREAIDRIWLFAPVRREDREWGTAVVSRRTEDGRSRIYTASYLMIVRGRERGRGKVTIEEVGESPPEVVHEVIAGVQERAGEPSPPTEIPPEAWFPRDEAEVEAAPGPAVHELSTGEPSLVYHPNEATQR
ncbi:MAG: hypothetical protein JSW43_07890 [Gemmatimonadota bacterium]|nr:MAG: hypothetical protein JSW43_07890 [Gemmatimonadota bacterium]